MNIPTSIQSPWMAQRVHLKPRPSHGVVLMELLLLGLAGLGGLALLLQQKPLPSENDVFNALKTLETNPDDPDANTVAGKYKAFVMGDYDEAMQYLKKSKDTTLKTLADHETDAAYTVLPDGKMKMGDEWVAAAKKFPALSRIFYDRGNHWYTIGWKGLDGASKQRARIQGLKMAASRPQGVQRKQLPEGWKADGEAFLDGTISRLGSYSLKLPPAKTDAGNIARSALIPVGGKAMELVAYTLSDGTENAGDKIFVNYFDQAGTGIGTVSTFIPTDTPFWGPVVIKANIPANVVRVQVGTSSASKNGSTWIDDLSLKFDGKDAIQNGSFEGK